MATGKVSLGQVLLTLTLFDSVDGHIGLFFLGQVLLTLTQVDSLIGQVLLTLTLVDCVAYLDTG